MSDIRTVNRVVSTAARTHLCPLGFRQRGRSRLWFVDRGWCLIVVDFEAGRSPGAYLNVGIMWLWSERDYWTFDEGSRLYWRSDGSFSTVPPYGELGWRQHAEFSDAEHFADEIDRLAQIAAERVAQLREQFPDVESAADRLSKRGPRVAESPLWLAFHAGAAAALHGDVTTAAQSWHAITTADDRLFVNWEHDLKRRTEGLLALVGDPETLQASIVQTMERSRRLLGLTPTIPR